jgi:hypothetical protein
MKQLKNCVCGIFFIILAVAFSSADDDGFLNVTCNEAQDCYVLDDVNQGLWLSCWYNVHKCKCSNTISSNFHLKWENNQCLMSKYGPCGDKGSGLAVGCSDNFICVDNQCRDPNDTSLKAVKLTPFLFKESKCDSGGCKFSDDLYLECSRLGNQCKCEKVYIADGRSTYWDIRNYDGDNDCSVGKFGPCGTNNGITIQCHGDGISCLNGICVDANHPFSDVGEHCQSGKNCKEGLLCSLGYVCIEPNSLDEGEICSFDDQCRKGLQCRRRPGAGPWSSAVCSKT